jgi:hypothetical protein
MQVGADRPILAQAQNAVASRKQDDGCLRAGWREREIAHRHLWSHLDCDDFRAPGGQSVGLSAVSSALLRHHILFGSDSLLGEWRGGPRVKSKRKGGGRGNKRRGSRCRDDPVEAPAYDLPVPTRRQPSRAGLSCAMP